MKGVVEELVPAGKAGLRSERDGFPVSLPAELESADGGLSADRVEGVIEGKHIGERIKHLRQRKGMGLVELGRHTGLSASFLSQLETGRVVPTLRNLSRIAMVFSRDLSYFFTPRREGLFRIQRAADRQRLPQTGAAVPDYMFESLGLVPTERGVVPYVAEFLPQSSNGDHGLKEHRHEGAEFLYVLSGKLRIAHGDRTEDFCEGDAVYFHATTPHSYQKVGEETCTAVILTLPDQSNRGQRTGNPAITMPSKRRLAPTA